MTSDEDLYQQTLDQYNDPAFARQYADNIANRTSLWKFEAFLPLIAKAGRILDVACAAGRDTAYLQNQGYTAVGIDYSSELIKIARQAHPDIEFVQGDFTELPFSYDSLDGIWCRAALVHLPSQPAVLKSLQEFYRVLKPGGTIMINTKARTAGQPETAIKKDALSSKNRYFRYQTEAEFTQLCQQVGFEILERKIYNEKDEPDKKVKRDENWLFVIAKK